MKLLKKFQGGGVITEDTEDVIEEAEGIEKHAESSAYQKDAVVEPNAQNMLGAAVIDEKVQFQELSFINMNTITWEGRGTASDPYTPENPNQKISLANYNRTQFAARTKDNLATVNGHAYQYVQTLNVGMNDIHLEVTSSDGTITAHYFLQVKRGKKQRPYPDFPSANEFAVVSPSAVGAADGKIVNLNPNEAYEYKLSTDQDWKPVKNVTEISGLMAGTYYIRYGESEEYQAGTNHTQYVIYDNSQENTIEISQNFKTWLYDPTSGTANSTTNAAIKVSPQSAKMGENIHLTVDFQAGGERRLVKSIHYKTTPVGGGFGAESDWDSQQCFYDNTVCHFNVSMPSLNTSIEYIVLYSDNSWYTVTSGDSLAKVYWDGDASIPASSLEPWIKVTPADKDKAKLTGNGDKRLTYCEGGSKIVLEPQSSKSGVKSIKGFKVVDPSGNTVVESADGSPVTVTGITDDLKVTGVRIVSRPADFSILNGILSQVPDDGDKHKYTGSSWGYLQQVLSEKNDILQLSGDDQSRVDLYATQLYVAILELKQIPPAPVYTVKLDTQGGTSLYPMAVAAGGCIPLPKEPARDGYIFAGWYQDKEYSVVWDFAKDVVVGDMTLYAKWAPATPSGGYTVTYEAKGGSQIDAVTGIAPGSRINPPKEPKREFYVFTGWFLDEEYSEQWDFEKDTVSGDMVLYAGWKPYKPPTPVITEVVNATQAIRIAWKKIPKVTGYVLYGYTGDAKEFDTRIIVPGDGRISCTDKGLEPGTKRRYVVRAYKNLEGKNYYSGISKSAVTAARPRAAVITSARQVPGKKQVKVSLSGGKGAEGYAYCLTAADGKPLSISAKGPKNPYVMWRYIKPGVNYIRARSFVRDTNGKTIYGNWSKVVKVTVK